MLVLIMAEIAEAFFKLSNQNKTFGTLEYFFAQRKINEEQEYLDKTLVRKNKHISVICNFVAIIIPNILVDEIINGFDVEIFGDNGYHYKAFISNHQGIMPHFLIPLKGDKKMFVNILPKIEMKEGNKYDIQNNNYYKNYIAFIEVPKRYQLCEQIATGHIAMEQQNDSDTESTVSQKN
jgi:hypothetical protein